MGEDEPVPPTNVQLVYDGDRRRPVDCVYRGRDREGLAVWQIVGPESQYEGVRAFVIERMPPHTRICAEWDGDQRAGGSHD
ncbi:hypothetical protein [Actinophytocola sp.]|uniref:hypothetical protein n=1 Tax=Actinophytocola sp. TaxID=1872138 RepID=UPI002D61203A|nr:hypothetical protein [Actinophytocola sp.]HYQ69093.1 hypothetical protein [Actinophytocola sp.]